jgi:phosphatidylglycerophosphatase A
MLATLSLRQRVLVLIGSIGPLGFLPASGTVTVAVVGLPLFWLTEGWSTPLYVVATAIFTLASVWLHQRGDVLLGEKDSRKLVWDEVAGFLIAVTAVPWTWRIALCAFVIERAIDIIKVPPARWIERCWPGGWGVVGDDVVAGVYTCVILHGLIRLAPGVMGLAPG